VYAKIGSAPAEFNSFAADNIMKLAGGSAFLMYGYDGRSLVLYEMTADVLLSGLFGRHLDARAFPRHLGTPRK
jgi:hypothetical protein